MARLIWIDVGTHFGQEYQSIFGSSWKFYTRLVRLLLRRLLRGDRNISMSKVLSLPRVRRSLREQRSDFMFVFVEANHKIIAGRKVYAEADAVFNAAILDESESGVVVRKLFLANGDQLSQGSSVFASKHNAQTHNYILTIGVCANSFFRNLESEIVRELNESTVMLRLNCEGVEDSVIYAAHRVFGRRLQLVCGSLKDVKGIKGDEAFDELNRFIENNKIRYEPFSSNASTWLVAHEAT